MFQGYFEIQTNLTSAACERALRSVISPSSMWRNFSLGGKELRGWVEGNKFCAGSIRRTDLVPWFVYEGEWSEGDVGHAIVKVRRTLAKRMLAYWAGFYGVFLSPVIAHAIFYFQGDRDAETYVMLIMPTAALLIVSLTLPFGIRSVTRTDERFLRILLSENHLPEIES